MRRDDGRQKKVVPLSCAVLLVLLATVPALVITVPGASDYPNHLARQPSDRARWFDGSQDIPVRCPEGAPDRHVLGERMRSMAQADFNALWIAGLDAKSVPRLPGYAIAYSRGIDTLLIKQAFELP